MAENKDAFLIKLVEDLSSLRSTVSNIENQLEKLDDKVVEPFQEWVFELKTLKATLDRHIKESQVKLTAIETEQAAQKTEISQYKNKLEFAKAYSAGIFFILSILAAIAYKIISVYLG